ncbi:hypothetical protein [Streptomyces sp. NBC_00209]|uniref:hypothetical protein n=1 Tax=Streptomyces sp. NBC_00209 TaxID=2975682 RepID=UPI002F915012
MTDAVRGSGEAAPWRPEGEPGGAPLAVPNASLSHWQGDGHRLSLRLWGGTAHLEGGGAA